MSGQLDLTSHAPQYEFTVAVKTLPRSRCATWSTRSPIQPGSSASASGGCTCSTTPLCDVPTCTSRAPPEVAAPNAPASTASWYAPSWALVVGSSALLRPVLRSTTTDRPD